MGKTQTALEYAHRHLEEYAHAFWASATSRETLFSGYLGIAGVLRLPEADAQDQTFVVRAVQRWLGSHERWLLILDNVDDLTVAREFLPTAKSGHALLTTRTGAAGTLARIINIEEMEGEEGALFLLRRAKYIAEDALLETAAPADQKAASEIVLQLGGLPLALDQAGAYLEETGCGLSGYLDLYRKHAPELLQQRGALASNHPGPGTPSRARWFERFLGYLRFWRQRAPEQLWGALASEHPEPVASTWALSFENISKANPAAAELLNFCAFLHPDAIPEEVLRDGAPELGPVLGAVASDDLALNRAISEILKYSLLRRDPNTQTLEIHRLVQAVLQQGMDEAAKRQWAERAVLAVSCAFPRVEFSTWTRCERLLAQAHACVDLIDQWRLEFAEAARLLNQAGHYLSERGQYVQAAPLYERALSIREGALGPDHPDVALSLNNLAMLYETQGRYVEAEPLLERALSMRERELGPDHPDVAQSLNNLAALYRRQARYEEAEPLMKRALSIREGALGRDLDPILDQLTLLYRDQGRYEEAEPPCRRALSIRERELGPDHPDVALSLNNLALLYHDQGRYGEAEPLYRRALVIAEQTLDPTSVRLRGVS